MITIRLSTELVSELISPKVNNVNVGIEIKSITTKDELCDSTLVFIKEVTQDFIDKAKQFRDVIIVTEHDLTGYDNYFIVDNTRLAMAKVFNYIKPQPIVDRSNSSVISPTAKVSSSATIEPLVFIDDNVTVGENTIIKSGSRIYSNTIIGNNSIIRENSVIGGQGFGVEKDDKGNNYKIHHFGGVIIGDFVEVGALNTVVSGTINPTVISDFTKIDDHVHIAHNCKIGKNCIITAGTILSGSVEIGDNCWLGPNSSVKNSLKITNDTLIGIGSVVTKNITTPNQTYAGNPAKEFRIYLEEKKKLEFLIDNFDSFKKLV